jgi:hypothetical protein
MQKIKKERKPVSRKKELPLGIKHAGYDEVEQSQ